MAISDSMEQGALVFHITGEIDHHAALSLREKMDALIREKRPQEVLLELSETDFMDSSGIGLILGRVRVCEACGASLCLKNPSERVKKVLDMVGAQKFLRYSEDGGESA